MELTLEGRMALQKAVQARLRNTPLRPATPVEQLAAGLRAEFEAGNAALRARTEEADRLDTAALLEENRLRRCLRVLRADVARGKTADLLDRIDSALAGERL